MQLTRDTGYSKFDQADTVMTSKGWLTIHDDAEIEFITRREHEYDMLLSIDGDEVWVNSADFEE